MRTWQEMYVPPMGLPQCRRLLSWTADLCPRLVPSAAPHHGAAAAGKVPLGFGRDHARGREWSSAISWQTDGRSRRSLCDWCVGQTLSIVTPSGLNSGSLRDNDNAQVPSWLRWGPRLPPATLKSSSTALPGCHLNLRSNRPSRTAANGSRSRADSRWARRAMRRTSGPRCWSSICWVKRAKQRCAVFSLRWSFVKRVRVLTARVSCLQDQDEAVKISRLILAGNSLARPDIGASASEEPKKVRTFTNRLR